MSAEMMFSTKGCICPDKSDADLAAMLRKKPAELTLFDVFDSIEASKRDEGYTSKRDEVYALIGAILKAYDEIDTPPGWKTQKPIDVDGALENYNDVQKVALRYIICEIITSNVPKKDRERLCKEICFTKYKED